MSILIPDFMNLNTFKALNFSYNSHSSFPCPHKCVHSHVHVLSIPVSSPCLCPCPCPSPGPCPFPCQCFHFCDHLQVYVWLFPVLISTDNFLRLLPMLTTNTFNAYFLEKNIQITSKTILIVSEKNFSTCNLQDGINA
jgi:hypothetical protein